jgi:ABC-2 type transport system ATP-binding protein
VDLEFGTGITGLLGPNGAGKTTMLRILATLMAPTRGSVTVDSWNLAQLDQRIAVRKRLGYLPQDLGLYPRFTVFQFVDYIAALKEIGSRDVRHSHVWAALRAVDLHTVGDRRIRTLSGGMQRRVGIAQAIVSEPDVLLLDEPTTGLDPQQRIRFRELIAALGHHKTVLLSTHLVEDIGAVCSTVAILWHGRLLFHGTPETLRQHAAGNVWLDHSTPTDAVASWRTESGAIRVVGSRPSGRAKPAPPTIEDGYLFLTAHAETQG